MTLQALLQVIQGGKIIPPFSVPTVMLWGDTGVIAYVDGVDGHGPVQEQRRYNVQQSVLRITVENVFAHLVQDLS